MDRQSEQPARPRPAGQKLMTWRTLNWPNRISLLRLLLVPCFLLLLMQQDQWPWARHAALGVLIVIDASDFLDGLLARRLNLQTRLGAILDPLADKVLIISASLALTLPATAVAGARLPGYVVVAVVGKDLWVIGGFVIVHMVTGQFRVHPTRWGKALTFAQIVMVLAVLLSPDLDRLANGLGGSLARAMEWIVTAFCLAAIISYTRLGLSFVHEGQQPLDGPRSR